jgi:methylenetetrahydrofolate--tRNA-(uracil-5-)-methyltransferase
MNKRVKVIGAGLAGCEAAWQLAERGIHVDLYEMKPIKRSLAHHSNDFAELVCSNSLRSNQLTNAVGVLKEEMRLLNSLIIKIADETKVPAGSALAVDRERFSQRITEEINQHPLIVVHHEEVTTLNPDEHVIIASGPLTSDALAAFIQSQVGDDSLYFYDAAAPIIEKDSIDFSIAYFKSRYDKGDGSDYINCPMTKEEFENFYTELMKAQTVPLKSFEKEVFFEGCMPFEEMARRGEQTLLFGPMKPVGLEYNDKRAHAVVQLRQDNAAASLYNIVGFQTHLTWPEQKRIIQMIPGLQNANIVRYGVMHRNSYLNSPLHLNERYEFKKCDHWQFAGQMTGVEGYVESAASGLLAGAYCAQKILGKELHTVSHQSVMGAMAKYISHADPKHFQPMNANFGLIELNQRVKKAQRKELQAQIALKAIKLSIEKL